MVNAEDDEEWEYEYDTTTTEDFYIPIDMSNIPAVQTTANTPGVKGHPVHLKSKLRALHAEHKDAESMLDVQGNESSDETLGELQITGLHTENPLLLYNGQLLSCQWLKCLGTDLIFKKPDDHDEDVGTPLQKLPAVDFLAMGSAKLVARVAQMRPRDDLFDDSGEIGGKKSDEVPSGDAQTSVPTDERGQDSTATRTHAQQTMPAPTSFLGRLNAIKARRGEATLLALSGTRQGARLVVAKDDADSSDGISRNFSRSGT